MKGRLISDLYCIAHSVTRKRQKKLRKSLTYLTDLKGCARYLITNETQPSIRVVKLSMSPEQKSGRKERHDGKGGEKTNRDFPG